MYRKLMITLCAVCLLAGCAPRDTEHESSALSSESSEEIFSSEAETNNSTADSSESFSSDMEQEPSDVVYGGFAKYYVYSDLDDDLSDYYEENYYEFSRLALDYSDLYLKKMDLDNGNMSVARLTDCALKIGEIDCYGSVHVDSKERRNVVVLRSALSKDFTKYYVQTGIDYYSLIYDTNNPDPTFLDDSITWTNVYTNNYSGEELSNEKTSNILVTVEPLIEMYLVFSGMKTENTDIQSELYKDVIISGTDCYGIRTFNNSPYRGNGGHQLILDSAISKNLTSFYIRTGRDSFELYANL